MQSALEKNPDDAKTLQKFSGLQKKLTSLQLLVAEKDRIELSLLCRFAIDTIEAEMSISEELNKDNLVELFENAPEEFQEVIRNFMGDVVEKAANFSVAQKQTVHAQKRS